ncbi:MAG TPA: dihydrodipicolinate reductase C-terminal domain-containing protein [Bryobacteraceae bacterium]|nr:dihydrodipicolinate reductase C-terminal domain-containing protein [Bryobacteraceae bacterium]
MADKKRLALVGHGKMGRLIEQLAPQQGFEVALILASTGNAHGRAIRREAFGGIDVAIEFTNPEATPANLKQLAVAGVPAVCGTTGWFDQLPLVTEAVESAGNGLVYSPNFSIGVAVFRRLVADAAALLKDENGYGAWAWEIHHDTKKDAPSGTLLHLVETMRLHGFDRAIDVSSNRAGRHPGTHEVGFDSSADTITLRHVARSREGFALGALKAARWISEHRGVHTFEEVLFGK